MAPDQRPPAPTNGEVYTLKEAERKLIVGALLKSKGNKSLAAQMLGISRKSLWEKLRQHGLGDADIEDREGA